MWLTPVVLLPGVAMLVLSTSARYSRLHEELHYLRDAGARGCPLHLRRRARGFRNALVGLYVAVVLLCTAGLVGALAAWLGPRFIWLALGLTFVGIFAVVYAAVQLVREALHSYDVLSEHFDELDARK